MESRVVEMTQARLTSNDLFADWVYLSHRLLLAFDESLISTRVLTDLLMMW